MKCILTATDLSARSDRAFERALALAKETGASLNVLYVCDEDLPSRVSTDLKHAAREDISKRLKVRESDGMAEIHIEVGQPWKTIVEKARELGADLIILGTHKNRGIADLFAGTTLERVAKYSDTPVLLVHDPMTGPYHRAIVGVDFTALAQRAVEVAAHVAPTAHITLVHAYHIPFKALTTHMDATGDVTKKERDSAERPLRAEMGKFEDALGPLKERVTHKLCEGGSIDVLGREVRKSRAHVLALGVHARAPLISGLLGSTAIDAMSAPPCDVLLVPTPRTAQDTEAPA